ncbi:MAG: hypothetical protein CMC82_10330 [Flavobacteriaceae bacterium]|nr:hypothetical protein [Flavobacteriaceae bacterium]|tara:strand:+ start:5183 stop:5512 length:330 start_codon:yes stop_codon:yes gene_type:complete
MLRSKYKKEKENLLKELSNKSSNTIMLSIILKGTSKVKDHFIYECIYLDEGEEKQLAVIAENMISAVEKIKPLVNKNISGHRAQFIVGADDDVILSRIIHEKQKIDSKK